MTKMQIVAKTALTVLGMDAIIVLLRKAILIIEPPFFRWQQGLSYLLLISLIITIAQLLIFNNDSIAVRITGAGEKLSPNRAASFLACSYRIGLVFYGLICLYASTWQFNFIIARFNPMSIRMWINNIYTDGFIIVDFCQDVINFLPYLLITTLTIYLIIGAPHFTRSQAKRLLQQTDQP